MSISAGFAAALIPPAPPDPIEWAKALTIPPRESASSPGPYVPEPYHAEIIRAIACDDVRAVTAVVGTQGGKTLTFSIGLLYRLDTNPGNTLIGTATQDMAKSLGRERLQAIIDENAVLSRHKPADCDRYKVQEMSFDRALWVIAGTQSSNGLISRPCRDTWIDEAQRAAPGAIAEAEQRTKRYTHTHKHLRSGTPTTPENDLWKLYLSGTQEHWLMPCPHCATEFAFQNYSDERTGTKEAPGAGLTWSPEAKIDGHWNEALVRKSACYICPNCRSPITEAQRLPMVRAGRFQATNLAAPATHRSFWVPSLCTREIGFGEMAVQFLRALHDFFGFREFLNGYWALPFAPAAAAVGDDAVAACRSDYRTGHIPFVPRILTLCADPGDTATHWEIAAHGPAGEFAVIDYGTTLAPEDLLPLLAHRYPDPEKKDHPVSFGLVDAGDQARRIYRLCASSGGRLFPSKGSGAEHGRSLWGQTELRDHLGLYLVTYIDHAFKLDLYLGRIARRQPSPILFPSDATPAFLHGHCGQRLRTDRTARGVRHYFPPVAHDHYGDCTKLNLLCAAIANSQST